MKREIEEKLEIVKLESKRYLTNYHASLGAIQILEDLLKDIDKKDLKPEENGK